MMKIADETGHDRRRHGVSLSRSVRSLWVCVAVMAALALVACGGATDARAAAKLDAGRLAAIERLGAARYRAIERVYVAALPFDEFNRPGAMPTPGDVKAASKPMFRACRALNARDALLGPLRASCPAAARFLDSTVALSACSQREQCKGAIVEARAAAKRLIAAGRVADRAVKMTRLRRACKRVLITPGAAYTVFREFDAALGAALRALESGSSEGVAAALRRLAEIDQTSLPTARQLLRRLRSGCR